MGTKNQLNKIIKKTFLSVILQDCHLIEGRPALVNRTSRHGFLLFWPWSWPDDLDIRNLDRHSEGLHVHQKYSFYRLSKCMSLNRIDTDRQTDATECITTPHSPVWKSNTVTHQNMALCFSIKQTRWYKLLILSTRPTVTSKPKRSPALAGIKLWLQHD